MAKRHMQRCSPPLVVREMQIKSTMRYHLRLVRMTIIKLSTNNKCWRLCGEKGMHLHSWWEYKPVGTTDNSREAPYKTKNRDFLGGSMVGTPHFQYRGHGSNLWWGTKISHAA